MGSDQTSSIQKKTSYLPVLIFLVISPSILMTLVHNAYASYPFGYYLDIERTIYHPGDVVVITIHNNGVQNPQATVTIRNGMGFDNYENAEVFYKEVREEKQFENGMAVFKYQVPPAETLSPEKVYRFYVEATGKLDITADQVAIGNAFFFTNAEASKTVISDLVVDDKEAKPGGVLTFNAKVTDGLGKALPSSAYVEGRVNFPSEDCNMDYSGMGENVSPSLKGADYLAQYKSSAKVYGWINVINEIYPGDYDFVLRASGSQSFQPAEKHMKIHISGSPKDVNVIDVFKMELRSDDPDVKLSNGNHEATLVAGKNSTLYLDGFSAINICGSILSDYPLSARLLKADPLIAPKPGQESIEDFNMTTNARGTFTIPINVTGFPSGNYLLLVDMIYGGVLFERGSSIDIHDVRDYPIHENGQDFKVHVDAGYASLQQFNFDKAQKKITLMVSSSNSSYNRMEISVPYGLLSGDFSVLINGKERPNDNLLFLNQGPNSTNFSIISMGENISQIDFIGTNVVPEFGASFVIVIAVLSIAISFTLVRRYLDLRNSSKKPL